MKYQTILLALLLALCTIFALCGCNAQAEEADAPTQKSSAPAPSAGSEPVTDGEAETTEAKIEMLEVVVKESDFTEAVHCARALAREGDVVLLSPACASFDAFPNFAARGEFFKSLVRQFQEKE